MSPPAVLLREFCTVLVMGLLLKSSSFVNQPTPQPHAVCPSELPYSSLEARTKNLPWIDRLYDKADKLKQSMEVNVADLEDEAHVNDLVKKMEHWELFLDKSGMSVAWKQHLDSTTPLAFQNIQDFVDCRNSSQVTIEVARSASVDLDSFAQIRDRAVYLLRECGFVVLKDFFETWRLEEYKRAFDKFRVTDEADRFFRYPCQGRGRIEYMIPFRPPFNLSTALYQDSRLHDILFQLFVGRFKLELQTVITSTPGSGNQRWHQGFQYLFHPEERLPPYAVVVGIPLVNVTQAMGPTEFCPRKKLRFYQGYTCGGAPFSLPSSLGTAIIFDYKTLHRGPANPTSHERPMISMVFSKLFFLNQEALVNRGVTLLQTLHQRRYWEQFFWHPDPSQQGEFFRV